MITGDRLKILRKLIKLSRREVQTLSNGEIQQESLAALENGRNQLTNQMTIKIYNFFKENGVCFSIDWLIMGIGEDPKLLTEQISQSTNYIKELEFFKKNNPTSIILTVSDDSLSPLINVGDVVGAIPLKHSIDLFLGILNLKNGTSFIGIIETTNNGFYLLHEMQIFKSKKLTELEISSLYQIIWIRKQV